MIDNNLYSDRFGAYDSSIVGQAVISITNPTHIFLGYPQMGKGIQYNKSDIRVGYATGWYKKDGADFLVQVEFENLQGTDELGWYQFGYVRAAEYRLYKITENKGAQSMMNELLDINRRIIENNLLCARLITLYDKKGIPVPKSKRKTLHRLQSNYEYRTNRILNSVFLKNSIKVTKSGSWSKYQNDLQNFMNNPKIGVAPVVIYVIGSVVITALISGIIYLIFRGDHSEAKKDIVYSDQLTADLIENLPEDVYEQLKKENADNTKEFNKKIDDLARKNTRSSLTGSIKTIGYGIAGILGFMFLTNLLEKYK
ncbi:MAG: hypothetical protein GX962_13460 [Epulopiscium sp.]|nr:hypothetical protein [Candidatus Epulonipiscium sp.]